MVDDHSTDDGCAIAREFPVTMLRTPVNSGQGAARNLGVAHTTADVIALLDADDMWLPEHLATTSALLARFPEAALACGRVRLFGDVDWDQEQRLPPNRPVAAYWEQYHENVVIPSSCLVRRAAWDAVGGFDEGNRTGTEDFEFFLRLAEQHAFVMSDQVTTRYRKHGAQLTTAAKDVARRGEYDVRVALLDHARRTRPPEFVARMERAMLRSWTMRLEESWSRRSRSWMRFYLDLHPLVPRSALALMRWRLRARMLPLACLADRLRGMQSPLRTAEASDWPAPRHWAKDDAAPTEG